jgi:hypothetical protein
VRTLRTRNNGTDELVLDAKPFVAARTTKFYVRGLDFFGPRRIGWWHPRKIDLSGRFSRSWIAPRSGERLDYRGSAADKQ